MEDIIIEKKDESHLEIFAETSILYELQDVFTFYAEGYKFHPKYRSKLWDGKIRILRILSKNKAEIYVGLLSQIISFCQSRGYSYKLKILNSSKEKISEEQLKNFIKNLNLFSNGQPIQPRDYQLKGFYDSIVNKRILLLSPTSSGKSLIIYLICQYLMQKGLRGLIIVPNISLVHQMTSDFEDYSNLINWNVDDNVHKIYQGQDKNPSLVKIECENGKVYTFKGSENVKIINNNRTIFKKAEEIDEYDEIDDRWLREYFKE